MDYSVYAVLVIFTALLAGSLTNNRIRKFLVDPFNVTQVVHNINSKASLLQGELHHSHKKLDQLHVAIERYEQLYNEWRFHKLVTDALDDATPDMMWAKDIYGKYVIANKQIRDCLLFNEKPYGKTDIELALARKNFIGDRNHTFGEVCGNSDQSVLEQEKPMRFVEWGTVTGKLMVLEVHKNVIRDESGNVIGTCGVARDITEEYQALADIAEGTECDDTKKRIYQVIDKYKFENKDV